jgi:glutaredoxin-related protein
MGHKCYISFKTEDIQYKIKIQNMPNIDMIDKSLNTSINSYDEDYIMQKIRNDYLSDSTVTIFLIGNYSSENLGKDEQKFIKRELQASLYNSSLSPRSGILGIVLPQMESVIYQGSYICPKCGNSHNLVNINDTTVVKEFSYNYYIPNGKCAHSEEDRYCVLVSWTNFVASPNVYIDQAFEKRDQDISRKVKVYP